MKEQTYIYILSCPISGSVRYIGKTLNLKTRKRDHIRRCYETKSHKNYWIRSLVAKGLAPIFEVLDAVESNEASFWEMHYISLFKSWGFDLTNGTHGGDGCVGLSLEARKKISESLKGKKPSEQTLKKRSESSKKTWQSPALRSLKSEQSKRLHQEGKISTKGRPSNKKGVPLSEEQKQWLSLINTGTIKRPEISTEEIAKLYLEGHKMRDIAKTLGTTLSTVIRRLKIAKVKSRRTLIDKSLLEYLYITKAMSRVQIAEQLNYSKAKIEKDLRFHGLRKNAPNKPKGDRINQTL